MTARLLEDETAAAPTAGADLAERIRARAGGGRSLPPEVRAEAEAGLGRPLGDVRLHDDAEAADLASRLGARAFTSGSDIFFNSGEYHPETPDGFELLTHELTHTLQHAEAGPARAAAGPGLEVSEPHDPEEQVAYATARRVREARESPGGGPAGPAPVIAGAAASPPPVSRAAEGPVAVAREGQGSLLDDLIPDFVVDAVHAGVAAIPGYTMLTQVIGTDPITQRPVQAGPEQLIESVLTFGPFGAATGRVLNGIRIVDQVLEAVHTRLAAHDLTLERVVTEVERAWGELSVTAGVDGNVAVVHRHVDSVLADARAAVAELVEQVLRLVRSAIAEVVAPLLERPEVRPVWELATKVLHYDPLRGTEVNAPTVEILADFLKLVGKEQTLEQLRERGTLQQAADWLDTQFATFSGIRDDLVRLFADAWDAIQPANLPRLLDTLPALVERAVGLARRIGGFVTTLLAKALELVRGALIGPLGERARRIQGFTLLTVVIGRDPLTGEAVPRNAENLIKGFITLLRGGEATYEQLAESGVVGQAAARIEGEISRLGITPELIVDTFRGIWDSLTLDDLLDPVGAFTRILDRFGEPLGRIVELAGTVLEVVVTLILRLMNFPSDLLGSIIANAMSAIEDIKRDPAQFLLNMLQALKAGFLGFLDGIGGYLLQGLGSWLTRGLGQLGITVPAQLDSGAVLDLALQVLGVSADTLWQKLGERIGPERVQQLRGAVDALSGAWSFLRDVQERGAAAVYQHVADRLGDLWNTVLGLAMDWITKEVVEKAAARLLSMLDPTGVMAVIRSCQAFFNAVQSAVEYLREILQIVDEYTRTIAQVARGDIQPGAEKITHGLADGIPVAIGFLANQIGIGNVPEQIVEIIKGLRRMVDEALDWLFDQAVRLGSAALGVGGPAAADDTAGPGRNGDIREQTVDFELEGHPHQLFAKVVQGELVVEMASLNRELLMSKLVHGEEEIERKAAANPADRRYGTARSRLRKQREELERQKLRQELADHRGQREGAAEETRLYGLMVEVASKVQQIGVDFDIESLKEDPDVLGGVIRDVYVDKIRQRFYGPIVEDESLRDDLHQGLVAEKANHPKFKAEAPALFAEKDSYVCPGHDYQHPHLVSGGTGVQIEHWHEVVEHWNGGEASAPVGKAPGRGSTQAEREAWNNSRHNLKGMCGPCNRKKERERKAAGGKGYEPAVLTGFEGKR
nr:DUF4157 domain-containing protein [Streptomyces sp. TLI_235]